FARDAEVFLPEDEGPLESPRARGLLAHELTHAAQQRVLGSNLPAEESDAGRALEAQANASERWALGLGAPPSAAAPFFGSSLLSGSTLPPQTAPPSGSAATAWTAPWQPPASGHVQSRVQRQVGEAADMSTFAASTATTATAQSPQSAFFAAPPSQSPADLADALSAMAAVDDIGVTTSPYVPQPPDSPGSIAESALADPELKAARDKLIALTRKRPLDLDDPHEVRALADEVYKRVH